MEKEKGRELDEKQKNWDRIRVKEVKKSKKKRKVIDNAKKSKNQ